MTKQFFAIDLGNGDFKVASSLYKSVQSFPAVVGQLGGYTNLDLGSNGDKIENLTLKRDGREYAIGKMALKNSTIRNHDITDEKYVSPDTMLLSHATFAMLSEVTYSIGNVVIGLPIHKLSSAQTIIRAYQGQQFGGHIGYYGRYDGKLRNVNVDKVMAVAQPHGTLFNLILDDKGQIVNRELAKSGVAIYDIGFKTNDGVVFKNLEPIGRLTIHSKNGMYMAYEEIRSKISTKFSGLEVKIFEVPEVVKTGQVRGLKVDDIVNDAFYTLASNIILELRAKWGDAWEIEQTIFTGGGAVLLKPYLQQSFNAIYKDAKSNAEGMLKYAIRLWGRE